MISGNPEPERVIFHRLICENPADTHIRLVFADWLQEHGEEDRAEFIRTQIALDHMNCDFPRTITPQWFTLIRREKALFTPVNARRWGLGRAFLHAPHPAQTQIGNCTGPTAVFRRGFVESIACPARDITMASPPGYPTDFAISVFEELPVTQIDTTDTHLITFDSQTLVNLVRTDPRLNLPPIRYSPPNSNPLRFHQKL